MMHSLLDHSINSDVTFQLDRISAEDMLLSHPVKEMIIILAPKLLRKAQLRWWLHKSHKEAMTTSLHVKAAWSLLQWQHHRTKSAAHLVATNPFLHGGRFVPCVAQIHLSLYLTALSLQSLTTTTGRKSPFIFIITGFHGYLARRTHTLCLVGQSLMNLGTPKGNNAITLCICLQMPLVFLFCEYEQKIGQII